MPRGDGVNHAMGHDGAHDDGYVKPLPMVALGAGIGACWGVYKAMWGDLPIGRPGRNELFLKNTLGQIGRSMGLMAAVGAAYTVTKNSLVSVRGKDDVWNKVGACASTGAVIGVYKNSVRVAFGCGIFLGIVVPSVAALTRVSFFEDQERRNYKLDPFGQARLIKAQEQQCE